jgi:HSP20 family protein
MALNKPMRIDPFARPILHWENTFGFPLFQRLSHELDALFEGFGMERPVYENTRTAWAPTLEMFTKNNELFVKLDVPGIKKEEITIELTDGTLIVRGERKSEKEEKEHNLYTTERTYGSFYRTVVLPEGAKFELAKATLRDGVLEITMPLAKVEEKTRKLDIVEPTPGPVNVKAA